MAPATPHYCCKLHEPPTDSKMNHFKPKSLSLTESKHRQLPSTATIAAAQGFTFS